MQLGLVVPGLPEALARLGRPAAPGLERLLARGGRRSPEVADPYALLLGLFGIAVEAGGTGPVAPLCRLADGGSPDDACWLRADPVHLVVDRDRVYLGGVVPVPEEEAQDLAAACHPLLEEERMRLETTGGGRWYLRVPDCPKFQAVPPGAAVGGDVAALLPAGPAAAPWRSLLTELQMALHGSSVNAARTARGEPEVNSLWPWGAGRLPEVAVGCWQGVHAGDDDSGCLARGLGLRAGLPTGPVPGGLEALSGEGWQLVVLEPPADHEALAGLDSAWFEPALRALRRGRLRSLGLFTEAGVWLLGRRDARRWWRRRPRGGLAAVGGAGR